MASFEQHPAQVRFIEITEAKAGQRLDNFLLGLEKNIPKSRIYKALRKGEVRVNKGRKKQTYKLALGDLVRVPPLHSREREVITTVSDKLREKLLSAVIFEDEHLMVIDKPAGLAVHSGSNIKLGVIEALRIIRKELPFLELVHRLDRDTSGCLILAKNRSSLIEIQRQNRAQQIEKRYLTLTKGSWEPQSRSVTAPLKKNTLSSGERMVIVDHGGKYAESIFTPQQIFNDCQLTEVLLKTGRTHQIRVHAQHIHHPLAGDRKYGDSEFNQRLKERGLSRLFLHAWKLVLIHPFSTQKIQLTAALPQELQALLEKLEPA